MTELSIVTFQAKEADGDIYLFLPPTEALDSAIGTSKWMVTKATADLFGRGAATAIALKDKAIQLVGPKDGINPNGRGVAKISGCSNPGLEW